MNRTHTSTVMVGTIIVGMAVMLVANVLAPVIGMPNDIIMSVGQIGGLIVLIGAAVLTGFLFGLNSE